MPQLKNTTKLKTQEDFDKFYREASIFFLYVYINKTSFDLISNKLKIQLTKYQLHQFLLSGKLFIRCIS